MDIDGNSCPTHDNARRRTWVLPVVVSAILMLTILVALLINDRITTWHETKHATRVLHDSAAEQAATLDTVLNCQYETLELTAATIAAHNEALNIKSICESTVILTKNSSFSHVLYVKPDGTAYSENGRRMNVSRRRYFSEAMSGVRSIEKVESSMLGNEPCFMLAVPILKSGRAAGLMAGCFTEEMLRGLILSRAYGGKANSLICDSGGNLILNADNAKFRLVNNNVIMSLSSSAKFSDGYFLEHTKRDLAEGRGGTSAFTLDNCEWYVTYMPLNIESAGGGQWFIFNVLPVNEMEAATVLPKWTSLFLFIFVMLVSSAMLLLIILRERENAKRLAADREQLRISEEQFRIAATHGERHVARYDIKTGIYHCCTDDDQFLQEFGKEVKDVPQCLIDAGVVGAESTGDIIEFYEKIRRGESCVRSIAMRRIEGGPLRWVNIEATIIFDANNKPDQAILVFYDITEQREKEAAYRKWQQSLHERPVESYSLFRCNVSKGTQLIASKGSLLRMETDKGVTTFNEQIRDYVGHCVYEEDRTAFAAFLDSNALIAKYYRGIRSEFLEFRDIFSDEDIRWIRVTVELVQYLNSKDIEAFLMFEDIDEAKRTELLTKEQAETDPLTGVLNRTVFAAKCEEVLTETKEGGLGRCFH